MLNLINIIRHIFSRQLPSYVWSEDYQKEIFARHFKAFDVLHQLGFFVGEFIWNFADFKTNQAYTRVGGNRKGIFTRQRQPKAAAQLVRQRYHAIAQSELRSYALTVAPPTHDLFEYVFEAAPNAMPRSLLMNSNELVHGDP